MMKCPAPACTGKRKIEKLFCLACWNRLPIKIRAELFRNWKASAARNHKDDLWWRTYKQSEFLAMHWLRTHPVEAVAS